MFKTISLIYPSKANLDADILLAKNHSSFWPRNMGNVGKGSLLEREFYARFWSIIYLQLKVESDTASVRVVKGDQDDESQK